MNRRGASFCHFLLLTCLLLSLFGNASAQTQSLYIDDNANIISKDMESKLTQLLVDIEKEQKFHVEVVILPNFYGKPANSVVNAYYQHMIKNTIGINYSALLVITLDKEYVQLITTPNIVKIFNAEVTRDITENVKKQLREKNYDEMARVGVAGILHYYQEKMTATGGKNPIKNLINVLFFLSGLAVFIYIVVYRRITKK